MATKFKFQAKDAAGKVVKGSVSAATQQEVLKDLRRRNLTPVEVSKAGGFGAMLAAANN